MIELVLTPAELANARMALFERGVLVCAPLEPEEMTAYRRIGDYLIPRSKLVTHEGQQP